MAAKVNSVLTRDEGECWTRISKNNGVKGRETLCTEPAREGRLTCGKHHKFEERAQRLRLRVVRQYV